MTLQRVILEKLGDFLESKVEDQAFEDGLLEIDDIQFRVTQLQHKGQIFVALTAFICPILPIQLSQILTLAMSANHFWRGTQDATFSYDPLVEQLFLSKRFSGNAIHHLSAEEVGDAFMDLFELAHHWQTVINQLDFHSTSDIFTQKTAHALSFGIASSSLQ